MQFIFYFKEVNVERPWVFLANKVLKKQPTRLIENEHYAADDVAARRDAVSILTGKKYDSLKCNIRISHKKLPFIFF